MTTWLDGIENPLLGSLAEAMGGTADQTRFEDWVSSAAGEAENLWRVSEGGPRPTNAVTLYTGLIDGVYLGNLAADASLRNPDVVALDTTNLGRLIISLNRAVDTVQRSNRPGLDVSPAAVSAADDLLRSVFGDLGEQASDTYSANGLGTPCGWAVLASKAYRQHYSRRRVRDQSRG